MISKEQKRLYDPLTAMIYQRLDYEKRRKEKSA